MYLNFSKKKEKCFKEYSWIHSLKLRGKAQTKDISLDDIVKDGH